MVSVSKFALVFASAFWLMLAPGALAADNLTSASSPNSTVSVRAEKETATTTKPSKTPTEASHAVKQAVSKEIKAEAIGEIDGVPLAKKDTKPEKAGFTIGDLNPLKWMFKPITDAQKEVKKLGKDITEIETPISEIQEPMVGLRGDMMHAEGQMTELRTGIHGIHKQIGGVNGHLERMEHKLTDIYQPIAALNDPVSGISTPVNKLHKHMVSITGDLKGMKSVVGSMSTAIIIAVVVVGLLVVVGTPIAFFLVWKHRSWVMKKIGGDEKDVKELQDATSKVQSKAGVG